ncbi:MAG: DeoR/GlpR family DNA-binding transcription regulator [Verrucomicrobiae bacterium]|nr:DeoR/GlpR family DNA-binding transcription regulator [Verrucomicrobiae bacterium]
MQPRHQAILDWLRARGHCGVDFLARRLGVSEMTIRRDLQALEAEGRVVRTHGGATLAERVTFEFSFLQRTQVNQAAKRAIAAAAVREIGRARTLMLDSGTTTLALAELLKAREGLTVITTSLPIASTLQFSPGIELLLLGGLLRRDAPDLGGALTEANLENLRADVAFIGADAIDAKGGVYNNALPVGRMLRKMADSAAHVFVLADSSKLGKAGLMRFGQLNKWTALITDEHADRSQLRSLKAAGATVILAPIKPEKKP